MKSSKKVERRAITCPAAGFDDLPAGARSRQEEGTPSYSQFCRKNNKAHYRYDTFQVRENIVILNIVFISAIQADYNNAYRVIKCRT